jgi:hypothetical protein
MVAHRRVLYICKLQRWYRTWVFRQRREEAVLAIQPLWSYKARRLLKQKRAARVIQRKYRSYCSLKWYHNWRKTRVEKANLLKQWLGHCQDKQKRRSERQRRRNFLEFLESGNMLYHKTVTFAEIDEVTSLHFSHLSPHSLHFTSPHLSPHSLHLTALISSLSVFFFS